jgi:hypothetical protein
MPVELEFIVDWFEMQSKPFTDGSDNCVERHSGALMMAIHREFRKVAHCGFVERIFVLPLSIHDIETEYTGIARSVLDPFHTTSNHADSTIPQISNNRLQSFHRTYSKSCQLY